jgi:hypothetical protein
VVKRARLISLVGEFFISVDLFKLRVREEEIMVSI